MTEPAPEGPPIHVEGLPAEEGLDQAEVEDELDEDPTHVPSYPETHPGKPFVEGVVEEPTDEGRADRLAPRPADDTSNE